MPVSDVIPREEPSKAASTAPAKERHVVVTGLTRIWRGVTSVADGTAKRGLRTTLHYLEVDSTYRPANIDHYRILVAPHNLLAYCWQFHRLLRREAPAHVELYHHVGAVRALALTWIVRLNGIPLVVICTGGEILYWHRHRWLKRAAIRVSLRQARLVVVKELYMKDYVRRYDICDQQKLLHVHNAIEVSPLRSLERAKQSVLFLNTLKPWRNSHLLIEAAPRIVRAIPGAEILIVGLTGRADERRLMRLAEGTKLGARLRLLPFTDDAAQYFELASVFVLPADVVYCNNALLEAMERGVPAVVADVPGAELIVEHGTNGLIVERDAEALADAVITLLRDEERRMSYGRAARETVQRRFAEEERTKSLWSAYESRVWS